MIQRHTHTHTLICCVTLCASLLPLHCRSIAARRCTDQCLSFISWNTIIAWFNNTFLKALPLVRKWFSFNKPSVHWVFFMLNWWLTHADWAQNLIICLPFCFNKLLIVTAYISPESRARSRQGYYAPRLAGAMCRDVKRSEQWQTCELYVITIITAWRSPNCSVRGPHCTFYK